MVYYEIAGIIPINKMKPCFGVVVYKVKPLVGVNQSRLCGETHIKKIRIEPHFIVDGNDELYLSEVFNINGMIKKRNSNLISPNNITWDVLLHMYGSVSWEEQKHDVTNLINNEKLPINFNMKDITTNHINCYYIDEKTSFIGTNDKLKNALIDHVELLHSKNASMSTIFGFLGENEVLNKLLNSLLELKNSTSYKQVISIIDKNLMLNSEIRRQQREIAELSRTVTALRKPGKTKVFSRTNNVSNLSHKRNTTKT